MKRRLLRSTLAIALVAVVTLGIPLLLLARHEVWSTAQDALAQQAASTAAGLEEDLDAGTPLDLTHYAAAGHGRRIVVVTAAGERTSAGPRLSGELMSASVRVNGNTVTVQADRHPTAVRAREVTGLVIGLSLLAVGTAVALALQQAQRLARPLSQLHDRAEALGGGDFRAQPLVSGIAEIDGVSAVLERSARQLATTIELQRDFASDAAHQLRTPLTGIGLRLDELTRIGDEPVRQEAEDALAQVERLDGVITALLARARGDAAAPTRLELCTVLSEESDAWARALASDGRRLSLHAPPGLWIKARREHVSAVLNCLLDNAMQHGEGQVDVTATRIAGRLQVVVTDEGPGVPAELRARVFDRRVSGGDGTGIGLSLARSLAAAELGELELRIGSEFVLTLPEEQASVAGS